MHIKGLFHHVTDLDMLSSNVLQYNPDNSDYKHCYAWLKQYLNFSPMFMSVGNRLLDIYMTGYQHNFDRKYPQNNVLFSFDDFDGVFTDYLEWEHALCHTYNGTPYKISKRNLRTLFKPGWNKKRWLTHARKHPHYVQLIVPEINLDKAVKVCVKDKATKDKVKQMGYGNVSVLKIPNKHPWDSK